MNGLYIDMKCPACGYERNASDTTPEWQCPHCEIAYSKYANSHESNGYDLQLMYHLVPQDKEINSRSIYLYLKNDNGLEYALVDENGNIKRVRLFENDLHGHLPAIIKALKAQETLNENQKQALYDFFSSNGYQQNLNHCNDIATEYKTLSKQQERKRKKIIVACVLSALALIVYTHLPKDKSSLVIKDKYEKPRTQVEIVDAPASNTLNLKARGINLAFLSSKLDRVNSLVTECRISCQKNKQTDKNCDNANQIMGDIHLKVTLYKEYIDKHGFDRLDSHEQKTALQINQYLGNIAKEMEIAKSLCQNQTPPPHQQQENTPKPIDLRTEGLNLTILYSKVYSASNEIRSCRLHCESGSYVDTNCTMFIALQKEYKSDVELLFDVIHRFSITTHSKDIASEDIKNIGLILDLLKEIEDERVKVIECVQSLR